ncbi:MAG: insulinase family protein, partial [Planctomycetota bacterium]|nr:insulinase family protein [Planctomycetota bacterium]
GGVAAEEVDRVRSAMLKERELLAADSSQLAIQLSEWAAQGDWRLYFLHRDRLEMVTAEQVSAAAKKYLKADNRTVGIFEPTQTPDRTTVPQLTNLKESLQGYRGREDVAAGERFDTSPANIDDRTERLELRSGVKGALLAKKTRGNSVSLRLVLRYGTAESLKGMRLAADLLPEMLTRGTKSLSRQQIEDELDRLRAELSVTGKPGEVVITIQARNQSLPEVLNLLRQMLREPSLPADEFDLLKQSKLAQLEEGSKDPQMLAMNAVRRHLAPYAKGDPRYVPTLPEEIESLKSISVESVSKLYENFLGGTRGELTVVGDFDRQEVLPRVESLLDGWKSNEKFERIAKSVPKGLAGGVERILTPDKENAIYIASQLLPLGDSDPDYAALELGNFVLGGGGLSSRLADRVRQKEGLSYGVASALQPSAVDPYSVFFIFAISNPGNTPKVQAAIGEEIAKLLADGVAEEELEAAKRGWLQEQQLARSADLALAEELGVNLVANRTMRHQAELEAKVEALTADDVKATLKKRIDLKKLYIAIAGDFEKK